MSQRGTAAWPVRLRRFLGILPLALIVAIAIPSSQTARLSAQTTRTYDNPLPLEIPNEGMVESCADPSVIKGQEEGDQYWYMYCTADPLNDEDRNDEGGYNFRLLPMLRSLDLVNWTYVGDAFNSRPSYARPNSGIWAPEIEYYPETGRYHLYYTVTETTFEGDGSAIGVAWSDNPTGPWTHSSAPVVEPHPADCCPGSRRWVYDPEVVRTDGPDYIYFGSYFGGISVRVLTENGMTASRATQTNVAVANKYEGPEVIFRDGYYYLFVSATDCCRGPLTGYSVFVGRSTSATGPFVDRSGVNLNENEGPNDADATTARVGGSPVLTLNGNRWVGPGHNTVFQDFAGQWWTIYHAIDRTAPYFEDAVNVFPGGCGNESQPPPSNDRCGDLNKRPALLDPIDWVGGWPMVNGGRGPSDTPQPAPAAQPGEQTAYSMTLLPQDQPGALIATSSDEFAGTSLGSQWSWVRQPAADTFGFENGTFRFETQAADLFVESDTASVLTAPAPQGDYMVETRVRLDVPEEGCCFNFRQAGIMIYGDDDNYVKLVHASIFNTRQTEFAKEVKPVPTGYPRYGNTVVGPPAEWTYLRIVKRAAGAGSEDTYTAYTSIDGGTWERGGTWTHRLGSSPRIGLVSMGGADFTANFDYVRVYRVMMQQVSYLPTGMR